MLRSVASVGSHTVGIRAAGFVIAALASSLSLTTAAFAGGSLKDEPVAAAEPTYVWDGLYVAAGIGVGKVDNSGSFESWKKIQKQKCLHNYDTPSIVSIDSIESIYVPCYWQDVYEPKTYPFADGKFNDDKWEVFGTLQVGYDRVIHDRILVGAFADIDVYPDADNGFHDNVYYDYRKIGDVSGNLSLNHVMNLGGRIGLLATPRILLYATGGYSRADLDGSLNFNIYHGPSLTLDVPNHMSGYFIGAGGEVKVDSNVSLKFEYRFTDLGSAHVSGSASDEGYPYWCGYDKCRDVTTLNARADLETEIHSVRAALVIKLGDLHREEAAAPLK